MANNSNFAEPGGAVAEEETRMSYPDKEQIGKIEQALEKAELDFRNSSDAKDFAGMMQSHYRICQLVADLSAAWSDGKPTVFTKYHISPASPSSASVPAMPAATADPAPSAFLPSGITMPSLLSSSASNISPVPEKAKTPEPASPEPAPAAPKQADQVPSAAASPAHAADDEPIDIAALEKQLAELASKMQKCLAAGDMDGMLAANEKMGALSDIMSRAEAKQKEKKAAEKKAAEAKAPNSSLLSGIDAAVGPAQAQEQVQPRSLTGGWSTGDTLALAKQRAEERKKQLKLNDSFENVVGQVVDKPETAPPAQATGSGEHPSSTVDLLFNDKLKSKLSSDQNKKPKAPMTQDQLREKLEEYNFYEILAVPSTASFEELHRSFLRKIRKLNQKLANKTMDEWQFQEFVAALCLAHDVLKFPNARLQYDLVIFGTDGGSSAESTAKQKMMPLKELLKFSTLINARELAEAVEKHKDVKEEREIGYYLVGKGLLSSEEFDSILFAQKLVSAGKLTVAQFELAMQEMRENSIPLLDTLVASEWIQPQDVFSGELL